MEVNKAMRDIKFACPHCEQHIQCEGSLAGRNIACPACRGDVVVPKMPDEHHLRITTGHVPVPTHAHGAPRAGEAAVRPVEPPEKPQLSKLAVASMSLSAATVILGPFGCILGIIFGHLAKAEIRLNPRLQGAELAKAGLIVGYGFLVLLTALGLWLIIHHTRAQ